MRPRLTKRRAANVWPARGAPPTHAPPPHTRARVWLVAGAAAGLAMIGLFGFISASCVPGSVPALDGIIPYYSGDVMAPFLPTGPDASIWSVGKVW